MDLCSGALREGKCGGALQIPECPQAFAKRFYLKEGAKIQSLHLFKKNFFKLYMKGREQKRYSICWFIHFLIPPAAVPGTHQSWEPGRQFGSSVWVTGTHVLEPALLPPRVRFRMKLDLRLQERRQDANPDPSDGLRGPSAGS